MQNRTEQALSISAKHNSTTFRPAPILFTSGDGVYLETESGEKYLDFLAGIAVSALGYGDTAVSRAVCAQAPKLMHISNIFVSEPQAKLLKRLTDLTFADRVFLSNSGTEANEAAIKLARRYAYAVKNEKERVEIVSMYSSFHGRTLGALAATGQPKYHKGFEPMIPGFKYAKFNDLEDVKRLVSEKTAAIIVEPIQGEGGLTPAKPEFLKGLRELCDQTGALLIFDEVQCGMGRTGSWYAYQHYNVVPDIMTSAKGLGGGFPIGATLATEEVFKGFEPGSHGTTYGGNPLGAAASLALIDEIERCNLLASVSEQGKRLKDGLKYLQNNHPLIKDVRGIGLMVGVEFEGEYARQVMLALRDEEKTLTNVAGGTTLRLVPPLVVSRDEIDLFLTRIADVLDRIETKIC